MEKKQHQNVKVEVYMWLKDIWGKIRESCACLNADKKYVLGSGSQICLPWALLGEL